VGWWEAFFVKVGGVNESLKTQDLLELLLWSLSHFHLMKSCENWFSTTISAKNHPKGQLQTRSND
jgi:hypothetical protein